LPRNRHRPSNLLCRYRRGGGAAAVSNAGGCGVLGTASLPGKFVRGEIKRLRELTDKPFGVNLVLPLLRRGQIEACFDDRVSSLGALLG
jgi:hypothetical protein